jgi:hypothetical protein
MSNILDLTNQLVSESFEDLVQHKDGSFYDGLGNLLLVINTAALTLQVNAATRLIKTQRIMIQILCPKC